MRFKKGAIDLSMEQLVTLFIVLLVIFFAILFVAKFGVIRGAIIKLFS